jgi:hypothetical protein
MLQLLSSELGLMGGIVKKINESVRSSGYAKNKTPLLAENGACFLPHTKT